MPTLHSHATYWQSVWQQFRRHRLGLIAFWILCLFIIVGIYAPFLASSKPLVVYFQGQWYFPLFRYLFYPGFFTKRLDIFYNLLIFTAPLFLVAWWSLRVYPQLKKWMALAMIVLQIGLFIFIIMDPPLDPTRSRLSRTLPQSVLSSQSYLLLSKPYPEWSSTLDELTPYGQLNLVLRYQQRKRQYDHLQMYEEAYLKQVQQRGQQHPLFPLLWVLDRSQDQKARQRAEKTLQELNPHYASAKFVFNLMNQRCHVPYTSMLNHPLIICDFLNHLLTQDHAFLHEAKRLVEKVERTQAQIKYSQERQEWLEIQTKQLQFEIMPLLRPFHWQDDAGGDQGLNHFIKWWDLTRINRTDMVASLLFGIRVSLSVGLLAIALALSIGIPIGAFAGYYGGKIDLISYRLIEIWESMPTFFMLLMIVAFLQSKSIFLIIGVIGFFGWTGFSRFIRGEFFRQKQLLYTEACRALGYSDLRIIFSHLLPNAIPPLLTLIPFAMMGAITSEAGLSFLGLGEEGSSSWGVLMDEGRSAFPSESYLLWPPAILLTLLLVAIALIGDALRDALDPKLHQV